MLAGATIKRLIENEVVPPHNTIRLIRIFPWQYSGCNNGWRWDLDSYNQPLMDHSIHRFTSRIWEDVYVETSFIFKDKAVRVAQGRGPQYRIVAVAFK